MEKHRPTGLIYTIYNFQRHQGENERKRNSREESIALISHHGVTARIYEEPLSSVVNKSSGQPPSAPVTEVQEGHCMKAQAFHLVHIRTLA